MAYLAPSVLSADFSRLKEELESIKESGCKVVHLDVMDGIFVPNITFGAPVIKSMRKYSDLIFDTHLMIDRPERYIKDFCDAGSDYVTVHQEATTALHSCCKMIHDFGKKAGVSINPATPLSTLEEILSFVDLVLIMSVNPGFGGQSFIETSLGKIARLSKIRKERKLNFKISVDGGVSLDNAAALTKAGCDWLVSGSSFFKSPTRSNFRAEIEKI